MAAALEPSQGGGSEGAHLEANISETQMPHSIRIDERLWTAAVAPEGVLEWWFRADGDEVSAGDRLAEVQIEGAWHELTAPVGGKLEVLALTGYRLDRRSIIGRVRRAGPASNLPLCA
jgi:hypothetical protein